MGPEACAAGPGATYYSSGITVGVNMDDTLNSKQIYLSVWKKALTVLLGWSEDQIERWSECYRRDLDDPDSMFYHEPPLYYVVPLLIPRRLAWRLSHRDEMRLFERLMSALEGGDWTGLPPELARLKEEMPLFEWLPLFEVYRQELLRTNVWLNELNVDAYDWSAAKRRVEKILEEYGETISEPTSS